MCEIQSCASLDSSKHTELNTANDPLNAMSLTSNIADSSLTFYNNSRYINFGKRAVSIMEYMNISCLTGNNLKNSKCAIAYTQTHRHTYTHTYTQRQIVLGFFFLHVEYDSIFTLLLLLYSITFFRYFYKIMKT